MRPSVRPTEECRKRRGRRLELSPVVERGDRDAATCERVLGRGSEVPVGDRGMHVVTRGAQRAGGIAAARGRCMTKPSISNDTLFTISLDTLSGVTGGTARPIFEDGGIVGPLGSPTPRPTFED